MTLLGTSPAPDTAPTTPTPLSHRLRTHPLTTELRRGIGPWAGLAVLVVIAFGMGAHTNDWQGHWARTCDLLRSSGLLLGGPLALAAGCWSGGRERRRRTGALRASLPRTPLRQTLLAAAPAVLWPAVGYLLAAAGSLLATWPYAGGGRPFLSLIAADAVAIASLSLLGFVAGRLVPWRLTAPLLAALGYVALGAPTYSARNSRWLSPALEHSYDWDRPVWWFGAAAAVWTAGLAAAALLGYAARVRAVALVPLAAAVGAAVLLVHTADDLWRPDPGAAALVCDDGAPAVCVTVVESRLLPEVSRATAGLRAKLRGVEGAPERLVGGPWEDGPGHRQKPRYAPAKGTDRLTGLEFAVVRDHLTDPALYANSAAGELLQDHDCTSAEADGDTRYGERATNINDAVVQWLAPVPSFSYYGEGAERQLKKIEAMSDGERKAYLTKYFAADPCDPKQVPVP
ncbi:hypothetical protein [Streptomyces sp. NPDC059009]|uniref:hypothetical protein n=1 Tax=Streptomyces sp. NPDC059009 TaxID=3346694 RepID=UPI003692F140